MPSLRRARFGFLLAVSLFFFCVAPLHAAPETDQGIAIEVVRRGPLAVIDASLSVAASPREVWDVLTDYDHMTGFLNGLQTSKILERAGDKLKVGQNGRVSVGPFSYSFDTVREVELFPFQEIRSRVISGSIKQGKGSTRLIPDGTDTRIIYHNETAPNIWLPPGVAQALIRNEVRSQLGQMKIEILRRRTEQQATQRFQPG